LWDPFDWITLGVSYQSEIKSHLSGNFNFKYTDKWQNMVAWEGSTPIMQIASMVFDLPYERTAEQTGTVTMDMVFPQIVNFGIKLKPVKRLSLLGDLHWANWSTVKEYKIMFDQKIQLLQLAKFMGYNGGAYNLILARDFKDTTNWGVGIEYQALDWLALRAGYENRVSSAVDKCYDLLSLPTLDYYGAGLGIKWKKDIDIDLAFGYMVNNSYKISNGTSVNMNSTQLGAGANVPYRGLNYVQEMSVYLGAVKVTMPLDVATGVLYKGIDLVTPSKWHAAPAPAKGSMKAVETGKTVDSSSKIINNLRIEEKNFYIEDSE
jgi:long-subunit fatty acid transport protein